MDIFEFVKKGQSNPPKIKLNINKNNKNLINIGGIAILSAIFLLLAYLTVGKSNLQSTRL